MNEIMLWITCILFLVPLASSIHVKLVVPKFVRPGSTVTLVCQYNLEGKKLYSVKWYRGSYEFFRYIPDDKPTMKSFYVQGIYVDHLGSSAHQVTLLNVPKYISGKISCEVSTDGTFSTASDAANLTISDIKRPMLIVSSNILHPDIPLQINCSAQVTEPLPTITFYVEDQKVDTKYVEKLGPGLASLYLPKMDEKILKNSYYVPIRVRCEASVRGHYDHSSSSIQIIPQPNLDHLQSLGLSLAPGLWIPIITISLIFLPFFFVNIKFC